MSLSGCNAAEVSLSAEKQQVLGTVAFPSLSLRVSGIALMNSSLSSPAQSGAVNVGEKPEVRGQALP